MAHNMTTRIISTVMSALLVSTMKDPLVFSNMFDVNISYLAIKNRPYLYVQKLSG